MSAGAILYAWIEVSPRGTAFPALGLGFLAAWAVADAWRAMQITAALRFVAREP
jgi:hypothetical protein